MLTMFRLYVSLVMLMSVGITSLPAGEWRLNGKISQAVFYPESALLRGYFNKRIIYFPDFELSFFSDRYGYGIYAGFYHFSFPITDTKQDDLHTHSTLMRVGVFKTIGLNVVDLKLKLALTRRRDDLLLWEEEWLRTGYEAGISILWPWSDTLFLEIEVLYNHEIIQVPRYVTFIYSRHQSFLSGETIAAGGYFLTAGISFRLL